MKDVESQILKITKKLEELDHALKNGCKCESIKLADYGTDVYFCENCGAVYNVNLAPPADQDKDVPRQVATKIQIAMSALRIMSELEVVKRQMELLKRDANIAAEAFQNDYMCFGCPYNRPEESKGAMKGNEGINSVPKCVYLQDGQCKFKEERKKNNE